MLVSVFVLLELRRTQRWRVLALVVSVLMLGAQGAATPAAHAVPVGTANVVGGPGRPATTPSPPCPRRGRPAWTTSWPPILPAFPAAAPSRRASRSVPKRPTPSSPCARTTAPTPPRRPTPPPANPATTGRPRPPS